MNRFFKLKPFDNVIEKKLNVELFIDLNGLIIEYSLVGNLDDIILPNRSDNPVRIYDLWEHTCFELFLKKKDVPWYIEYNFSSAGDWNCFYISSYRVNEGEFNNIQNQLIETKIDGNKFSLCANISFDELKVFNYDDFMNGEIEIGITSVIEENNGLLEYWAIEHKKDKPDFHDGFIKI